ncbi:MAG: SNF2-related protein, partial [Chloroflexota bacterium]
MSDSFSARFFNQVDRLSQERGRRYFQHGAVRFLEGDLGSLHAGVQGTRLYDVQVAIEKHVVNVSCTCPFFEREHDPCKHIWAALLAAEQSGYLARLQSIAAPHLRGVAARSLEAKKPSGRRAGKRSQITAWKQQLLLLRAQLMAAEERGAAGNQTERHLHYFIDTQDAAANGELRLQVAVSERKLDGDWGKIKFKKLSRDDVARLSDGADRRILATLLGGQDQPGYLYSSYAYGAAAGGFVLAPALWEAVLPLLCGTGRCALRQAFAGGQAAPLHWDEGGPWDLCLRIAPADKKRQYCLTGLLRREGVEMSLARPISLVAGGLVIYDGRIARLNDFGAFAWVTLLRARPMLFFAKGETDEFLDQLIALPRQPVLDLPEELRFDWIATAPKPRLTITAGRRDPWGREFVAGELAFDYGGSMIAASLASQNVYQKGERLVIRRDRQAEESAKARLAQLGFRDGSPLGDGALDLAAERVPRVVRALTQEGWRVEAEGKLYRNSVAVRLEINSGVDWFELDGGADFDGAAVALPKLLRAIRHGEQTVRLDDGSLGIIPEEWLAKYRLLSALGELDGERLRFTRSQAGLLDLLLADESVLRVDAVFERVREELRGFAGAEAADAPPSFRGTLRDYQREGLGWLQFLGRFHLGGCLADDMGLGKTIQVLALLEAQRGADTRQTPRTSLVVVPRSLLFH